MVPECLKNGSRKVLKRCPGSWERVKNFPWRVKKCGVDGEKLTREVVENGFGSV